MHVGAGSIGLGHFGTLEPLPVACNLPTSLRGLHAESALPARTAQGRYVLPAWLVTTVVTVTLLLYQHFSFHFYNVALRMKKAVQQRDVFVDCRI